MTCLPPTFTEVSCALFRYHSISPAECDVRLRLWHAQFRRMRTTGPLSATVFAVASNIGSAFSTWLSMPVTSAVLLRLKMTLASLPSVPPFAPRSTNVPLSLHLMACLDACVSLGPHFDFRFFLGLLVATLLTLHSNLSLEC
mgnify:CR=1 FL=1